MLKLIAAAAAALALAPPAQAGLRGHMPPEQRQWIAEASTRVPMPRGTVTVRQGACPTWGYPACYFGDGNIVYFNAAAFSPGLERQLAFYHEVLGHAVDFTRLSPGHRRAFRHVLGIGCRWADTGRYCDPPAEEMFAEQYAACAAGLPRASFSEFWFYDYAPPAWLEPQLCSFIRSIR